MLSAALLAVSGTALAAAASAASATARTIPGATVHLSLASDNVAVLGAKAVRARENEGTVVVRGDWGEPAGATGAFPEIVVQAPVELPAGVSLTPLETNAGAQGPPLLTVRVGPAARGQAALAVTREDGAKATLTVKAAFELRSDFVASSPVCHAHHVNLHPATRAGAPILFLMNCAPAGRGATRIAIRPSADVVWEPTPPGATLLNDGRTLVATVPDGSGLRAAFHTKAGLAAYVARRDAPEAQAAPQAEPGARTRLVQLGHFRLAWFLGFQNGGGYNSSLEPSWNPLLAFARTWGLAFNLGGTLLKATTQNGVYPATEYEALVAVMAIPRVDVEIGGGLQTWWASSRTTAPVFSANVMPKLGRKLLRVFDRVVVGYTADFTSLGFVNEFKVGMGISL